MIYDIPLSYQTFDVRPSIKEIYIQLFLKSYFVLKFSYTVIKLLI